MTSVQPDLHKFFKNKKNLFSNDSKKIAINELQPTQDEEVNILISSRKRKLYQIDDEGTINQSSSNELKKHLGKCSNLHELRERLAKFKNCEEKLNDFRKNLTSDSNSQSNAGFKLKHFKSIDIEIPLSPVKSPTKTPSKTVRTPVKCIQTHKKPYCHEQYAHLILEETILPLPVKYKYVEEVFRAVDTIVSLFHNRKELITFSKLKPAVQEMLKKTFNENHLGQLKTVFPLAYFFEQYNLNSSKGLADDYHLIIRANLKYKNTVKKNLFSTDVAEKHEFQKLNSIDMVDRRKIFHNSLLSILKAHHDKFLKSLDPPIVLNGKQLTKWHVEFLLEEVPDPESSVLPVAPISNAAKTANELIAKASTITNNRMRNGLESMATKLAELEKGKEIPKIQTITNTNNKNTVVNGISESLLKKIRAREAANAEKEMTRSTGQTIEREMHQRLPEMASIIRNCFIAEKKAALTWDTVVAKVSNSCSSLMSRSDVDNHLDLLIKEVPTWCTVHNVRSGKYIKIDKTRELQSVLMVLRTARNRV